mgnify:CR=1 FL=1
MKFSWIGFAGLLVMATTSPGSGDDVPPELRPWIPWSLWAEKNLESPPAYNDATRRMPFWPGRVRIVADGESGTFSLEARVFSEGFFPLPGDADLWPQDVRVDGVSVPVLERDGRPAVRLEPGNPRIEGKFPWTRMPQKLRLPGEYGLLSLAVSGSEIDRPVWDSGGFLWLDRSAREEESGNESVAVRVYALLEDGIPLWLRGEVEVTVSGRSREEDLGCVIPVGWTLASVESPLPAIIDDAGRLKAQVRPGRWVIRTSAFQIHDVREINFPRGVFPAAKEILLGFRAQPGFRLLEIAGAAAVDVSQTTYPAPWREFPVFLWRTEETVRLDQQIRGMGAQQPHGLRIQREWWLDEDGQGLTFRDHIEGSLQEIWRLDAVPGVDLGSVRTAEGESLLVTQNPSTETPGVEIRTRNPNLVATGRMKTRLDLPATGWQADAESLSITLNLPPGWRLLAALGPDEVSGDWLAGWTLLDLFLLLIFTLALFRLIGPGTAALGFVTLLLTMQERGAPVWLWLVLLIPLALARVTPEGHGKKLVAALKWAVIVLLVVMLAPFVSAQVQQALYPQLEKLAPARRQSEVVASFVGEEGQLMPAPVVTQTMDSSANTESRAIKASTSDRRKSASSGVHDNANLLFEPDARIQTGPGIPTWTWRSAVLRWNGPVTPSQEIQALLIPMPVERALSALRVLLVLALGYAMLGRRTPGGEGR